MKKRIYEIAVFGLLGAVMFISEILMGFLPNVHLLGTLTIPYTVVYRRKALYPIYIYVLLNGIYAGFSSWWVPYLYLWTILWAITMLLPCNMSPKIAIVVYMLVCALHGLAFGTLYAPFQALMFGLTWKGMIAWIVAGLPFDAVHAVGNLCAGVLILPIITALRSADKNISRQ